MYYNDPAKWTQIQKKAMLEVVEGFDSARMAREYYEKLYI
jgi:starch phosphorylase